MFESPPPILGGAGVVSDLELSNIPFIFTVIPECFYRG